MALGIIGSNATFDAFVQFAETQHAAGKDYDPTLCFGKVKILDIQEHSDRFCELLENKVNEIFSQNIPFTPTTDLKVCQTCPYLQMCRQ